MGKEEFVVDPEYQGYVFLGWAKGQFEPQNGKEKRPYHNIFVLSPVSDWTSGDYEAFGFKAEKKKCLGADVWEGLNPAIRFGCSLMTKPGRVCRFGRLSAWITFGIFRYSCSV